MFDFKSSENLYLFNPRLETSKLKTHLENLGFDSHVFILSSGTTMQGGLKGYALSKNAILSNAKAVNEHIGLTKEDNWLCSLPYYHIGGLSIYARAYLSRAKVIDFHEKWNVGNFLKAISDLQICSVVPLQCYDLVQNKIPAPKSLKYLIVGGDYLPQSIHQGLIDLNWPVLRTYGMTEVCSQLATEKEVSKDLKLIPLNIHELIIKENILGIKSPALFTGEFRFAEDQFNYIPQTSEVFMTNDLCEMRDNYLFPKGRKDQDFKIKGRRVDFNNLKKIVADLSSQYGLYEHIQLKKITDKRDGFLLKLQYSCKVLPEAFKSELEKSLIPLRISEYQGVSDISRTELGKLKTD